ncbi:MAG: response regulator [Spirochaetes bacterium]|nr:response regulator [Spirochaetota bacterium]
MKFSTRIFIYVFIASALIIIGLSVITHIWITEHHTNVHLDFGRQVSGFIAVMSEEYVLRNDLADLQNYYQSYVENDSHTDYIFIQKNSDILAHTFKKGVPAGFLKLPPVRIVNTPDITAVEKKDGTFYYHYRILLNSPPDTVLHLGISRQIVEDELNEHINLMIATGLLLLILVPFGLAVFLSRMLSMPLHILRDSVKRIGRGELDYRIKTKTRDEFQELADDINIMAEELEKSRDALEDEITERTLTEGMLEEQTELLNNIIDKIPFNVFWKDTNLVYQGCNRTFLNTFGMKGPEDVIGRTNHELKWNKEDADKLEDDDKRVLKTGKPEINAEEAVTGPYGQQRYIVKSMVPLKDLNGNIFGILGIFNDITERKQMEENLKQSQKMEAIGTLAGGIAHDFNNILGAIIGYTELAKDEVPPDSEAYNFLEMVLRSGSRAKELVKQILTFSRKSHEERRPVYLSEVIKEEVKLLRSALPATIDINLKVDDDCGLVNADVTQMHQVVMNLCTNAAHAMREKGGVLDISLIPVVLTPDSIKKYHDFAPGPYVELKISDTGKGIDPGVIHRIFEPFFTTKENGEGTGMGLAVVHGIIKDHKGDIVVESYPGKGTAFTILLPRVVNREDNGRKHSNFIESGKESVLFVDDEKLLLSLADNILTSLGYRVTPVNSSLEALELYQKSPGSYDIIVTDHTMPHMTGFDLSRRILEINPSARIILCTGYSESLNPDKVRNAGIMKLCYKPVTKKDIAVLIREALDS